MANMAEGNFNLSTQNECCFEGQDAAADLRIARAYIGHLFFDHIDEDVVTYREERCGVVIQCQVAKTGSCLLDQIGMKLPFPPNFDIRKT